ncbi:MAG: hypothetical protein U0165_10930 [Polyangiaceae bacterium]
MNSTALSRFSTRSSFSFRSLALVSASLVAAAALVGCADDEAPEHAGLDHGAAGSSGSSAGAAGEGGTAGSATTDPETSGLNLGAITLPSAERRVLVAGVERDGGLCVMEGRSGKKVASIAGNYSDVMVAGGQLVALDSSGQTSSITAFKLGGDELEKTSSVDIPGSLGRLLDAKGTVLSLSYFNGPMLVSASLDGVSSARYWMEPQAVTASFSAEGTRLFSLHQLSNEWLVRSTLATPSALYDDSKADVVLPSIGGGACGAKLVSAFGGVLTVAAQNNKLSLNSLDGLTVGASTTEDGACVEDAISTGAGGEVLTLTGPTPTIHRTHALGSETLLLKSSMAHLDGPVHRLAADAESGLAWVSFDGDVREISIEQGHPISEVETFFAGCEPTSIAVLVVDDGVKGK